MKKIINSKTFSFMLGIIIASVSIVSAYTLLASNIGFTSKDTAWQVDNVKDAIDGLYTTMATKNYSENEKVVGTWIDGKPLYMQTVIMTTPNSTSGTSKPVPSNIDTLVNLQGTMLNSNGDWNIFGATYGPFDCWYRGGSDELSWEGLPDWGRGRSVTITFYYTKTTDQANGD